MNLRALEAFRLVMSTGSMTTAARMLYTTQPNISRLISSLESEIDLQLFSRNGNKLVATDEGTAFFREVEQHYAGLTAIKDAARTIKQIGSGRLHVAVAPVLSHAFLAAVVARFAAVYPQVALSVRTCNSFMVEQLVNSHLCELGLAAFIGHVFEAGLEAEMLANVKGVCLLPADHPLASRKTIRARDLEGERFIATARQNGSRESVDAVFLDGKVNRKVDIEAENAATICHMVKRGLGVSVLSSIIVREFSGDGLVARPFLPPVYFPVTLLRSSLRPRSAIIATFIECLKEELRFVLDGDVGCTSQD